MAGHLICPTSLLLVKDPARLLREHDRTPENAPRGTNLIISRMRVDWFVSSARRVEVKVHISILDRSNQPRLLLREFPCNAMIVLALS